MSRRSFSERRRAQLRLKVDALDRLENRAPVSTSMGLFVPGAGAAAAAVALFDRREFEGSQQRAIRAVRAGTTRSADMPVLPFTAGRAHAPSGSAGAFTRHAGELTESHRARASSSDWLTLNHRHRPERAASSLHEPHGRRFGEGGGGAGMTRGGYPGLGHGAIAPIRVPPPPAAPDTGSQTVVAAPTASRPPMTPSPAHPVAAASAPVGAQALTSPPSNAPVRGSQTPVASFVSGGPGTGTGPLILPHDPGLLTPPAGGGSSGPGNNVFTNFPLYTLDVNTGDVFFPNTYQLATPFAGGVHGAVNLLAQVRGTTVSTYSWDTSGLSMGGSIAGASTANLTFIWSGIQAAPDDEHVTLTVTDTLNKTEVQSYYWHVPAATTHNVFGQPTSVWPETLQPDLAQLGSAAFEPGAMYATAVDGSWNQMIDLPSYNSNVPAVGLVYNSVAADARPIVIDHHQIDPTLALPDTVSGQLKFNGTTYQTYYYGTGSTGAKFVPGDYMQMGLQADATGLSTGRYAYSVLDYENRSGGGTTSYTYNGNADVINQASSAFGAGWSLAGLNQVDSVTGGVILDEGGGSSLWFATSGGGYASPAGDFSTLASVSGGGWTRTMPDGTVANFDSNGYQTAAVDRVGLRTTFAYDASHRVTTITDPYSQSSVLVYDGTTNKLNTITDPASRITTFAHSGGTDLTKVTFPDLSTWSYAYNGSTHRMNKVTDARSKVTTITYSSASRVSGTTRPDLSTESYASYQEQGFVAAGSGHLASPATPTLFAEAAASGTDANSNTITRRPDWTGLALVNQPIDPDGNVTTMDRDANGLATITIDRLNRISQDAYDAKGNVTKHTYPDLNTEQATYNSFAEPLTLTTPRGNTTTFTYDGSGNNTKIQDPLSDVTTMTYTANGRLATYQDPLGNTTTFQYDSQDRLTTLTHSDSTTILIAYDSKGNATTMTDERSSVTVARFDAMNRETGMTDAAGDIATHVYDSGGNLTADQEPLSRTTTYALDSMNRVTTVSDALAHNSVLAYDSGGRLTTLTDSLSRVTSFAYDPENRRTLVTDPLGHSTTTALDAEGQALTVTDPMSRVTTYTYGSRGWVATTVDPMGNMTTSVHDADGNLDASSNPSSGGAAAFTDTFDAINERTVRVDGLSHSTTWVYDSGGNVVNFYDANNNRTTYAYDSRNRLTTVTDALGHSTVYGFDGANNQTRVTDALSHSTTYAYDVLNRITAITDARNSVTSLAYDSGGRQTLVVDPNGNRTTYAYDAVDRLTTLTDALGTSTFSYDNANELTDKTDHDARRTTFAFDSGGRQTNERWLDSSGGTVRTITYTYNNDNQLTGATDPDATLTFTYDSGGRQVTAATSSSAGQPNVTLTMGYDAVAGRTSLADGLSSAGLSTYQYDAAHRLTTLTRSLGGVAGPQVILAYDAGNRVTSESRTIGGSGTAVNTTLVYDSVNRVVTLTHQTGLGTALATYVYGYDNANRLTSETNAEGAVTYAYDAANELTTVTGARTESYGYDSGGNRNTTGYTTGSGNEMTASPTYTYTYDAEGNLTAQTQTSGGSAVTTYAYDYRNRLTGATVRVSSGGAITAQTTYTYDALSRRIGVSTGGSQTWTIFDGQNPYADFNGAGALQVRYLYGAAIDSLLARTNSAGTTAWYLVDQLGSVRDITDASGVVIYHAAYDSWGSLLSTSGTGGDRFAFTAREYNSSVGDYYYRARYYDVHLGRFESRDRLGFFASATNLYMYCANEPTGAVDPSGDWLTWLVLVAGALLLASLSGCGSPKPPIVALRRTDDQTIKAHIAMLEQVITRNESKIADPVQRKMVWRVLHKLQESSYDQYEAAVKQNSGQVKGPSGDVAADSGYASVHLAHDFFVKYSTAEQMKTLLHEGWHMVNEPYQGDHVKQYVVLSPLTHQPIERKHYAEYWASMMINTILLEDEAYRAYMLNILNQKSGGGPNGGASGSW
jgi:RHS repeat-associated protein